jgi:hypothetical protein
MGFGNLLAQWTPDLDKVVPVDVRGKQHEAGIQGLKRHGIKVSQALDAVNGGVWQRVDEVGVLLPVQRFELTCPVVALGQ